MAKVFVVSNERTKVGLRHRSMDGIKSTEVTLQNRVIPPGPLLDELKANRLVTCDPPRQTFDTTLTWCSQGPNWSAYESLLNLCTPGKLSRFDWR